MASEPDGDQLQYKVADPDITGFRFMANKQFRMEKRLGTSVCADISKYALKNQYVQFLYE